MTEKIFKLKLGSVYLIKEVISAPGWALTTGEMYTAGKIVTEIIPDLALIQNKEELDKDGPVFTLSDKQFDAAKKAIKYSVEKGFLIPNKYTVEVFDAFNLA